mmetsp:Transcript_8688/g.30820  ORF Transcript_8688/g.30820 Transcript_8688/m.30820 type:complete len:443 (+) Transcript_8688:264-1592(+)
MVPTGHRTSSGGARAACSGFLGTSRALLAVVVALSLFGVGVLWSGSEPGAHDGAAATGRGRTPVGVRGNSNGDHAPLASRSRSDQASASEHAADEEPAAAVDAPQSTAPVEAAPQLGRHGIVVLGMHRSGTSALTLLLEDLGGWLSSAEQLGVKYDNPRGFGELLPVVQANDKLLAAVNGCDAASCWYDAVRGTPAMAFNPRRATDVQLGQLADRLRPVAVDLSGRRHNEAPFWVLKDPRLCLTLVHALPRLYDSSVEDVPVALFVFRNPTWVALSLLKRKYPASLNLEFAVRLWEAYNVEALRQVHELAMPIVTLHYEAIVANPISELPSLLRRFADAGVSTASGCDATSAATEHCVVEAERVARAAESFASHNSGPPDRGVPPDFDSNVHKHFRGPARLYAAMLDGSAFAEPPPQLSEDTARFFAACPPTRPLPECRSLS